MGVVVVSILASNTKCRGTNLRDGLNYYPIQFPGRLDSTDIEIDFDFTNASLDFYWDVNKPHKEMRAFAVPSGGLLFPQYFDNGNAAFLDTTLSWNEVAMQFPSEYCQIDMTGTIHCVANAGTTFTHYASRDGAFMGQSHIRSRWRCFEHEEWEFRERGARPLRVECTIPIERRTRC